MNKRYPQPDLFTNEQRRYLEEARRVAMQIAYEQGSVSADDVREKFPTIEVLHRNAIGGLFKTSDFVHRGFKKSSTPSRKGGIICTYGLSENAEKFLRQQFKRKAELCQS